MACDMVPRMLRPPRLALVFALALVAPVFGCMPSDSTPPPGGLIEPVLAPGCNPLGGGLFADCFTPYPSSVYQQKDKAGVLRIQIPSGVLPVSGGNVPISTAALNGRDGYSPATPMLAYFPEQLGRIDSVQSKLPGPGQVTASMQPASPVQVLDYATGERVPILAEVDENAGTGERQALLISPQVRLAPGHRYVVAIAGLKNSMGRPIPALAGFAALRDGKLDPGSVRSGELPHMTDLFAMLQHHGIVKETLQLAWDFVTASDETATGPVLRMRDQALAYRPPMPVPAVTVSKVTDKPMGRENLWRQIVGTYAVPSFLTDDATGRLARDATGQPQLRGMGQFALVIHVPACAERVAGPLPVMIYGHGLFGGAQGEMESGYQREVINRLCMVQIGSDWIGLASADRTYVSTTVLKDFNEIVQLTDRLQQAHVNFAYLANLIATGGLDGLPALQLPARMGALLDKTRVYYYGISNGGIQGMGLLALSPHIKRGALCVPGGFWTQMMFRSSNFSMLSALLAAAYPDPLDRQLIVALSQSQWDHSDPVTWAPHILRDPLPQSGGKKQVLYQEGIGDAQVPNLATRAMVRTIGLSHVGQPVEPVPGVAQEVGPLDSGYVQYDIGQQPRPGDTNVPPMKDNPVHGAVRKLEAAKVQLELFLREGGQVTDTCKGMPCVFAAP